MTLYAERKPSRHRPFAIIETRGSGKKGMIGDPKNKAKSVWLTDEGLAESERLFKALFCKPDS